MLYSENLEEFIFNRHELLAESDELMIISGYVGPSPIERLRHLPFNTTVVYGMYGADGIQNTLHDTLVGLQNTIDNVNIHYSNIPVHSKCYAWRSNGSIVHALVGSANFSSNGLRTPYREILAETTRDTFQPLNTYIQRVINNSISCLEVGLARAIQPVITCRLTLLGRDGEVQNAAGLNWGQNPENHTRPNDAYIKIRTEDIRRFPDLFPPKQINPMRDGALGRRQRHNDAIEIIWDDGITMEGLLEANQTINGIIYPKQISSFPIKSQMGEYFRTRLGVPFGQPVRKHHLVRYGRTDVTVSKISECIYKFDFSV